MMFGLKLFTQELTLKRENQYNQTEDKQKINLRV